MAMPDAARQKLKETFQDRPLDKQIGGWEELWQQSTTPWDRAGPSLAVLDAVRNNPGIFEKPVDASGKRKRALVPGCGRGYDVLQLSAMGYDVVGLDSSESAIAAARKYKNESGSSDAYAPIEPGIGSGDATFVVNDFFKDDFLAETKSDKFDLIFDYTFLCALPPRLRPQWAKRQSQLLAKQGRLLCLEWPLHKPPKEGGPPHGLSKQLYIELFRDPGQEIAYDVDGHAVPNEVGKRSSDALVQIARFRPERTHEAGKDSDFVSIYAHEDT